MTIINNSLVYSADILVYNNECELLWPGDDPYNPLNLPANTVRVRTSDGNVPYKSSSNTATYETATLVEGTSDVYDVYKSGTDFNSLFNSSENVVEVLGANPTGITTMKGMFYKSEIVLLPAGHKLHIRLGHGVIASLFQPCGKMPLPLACMWVQPFRQLYLHIRKLRGEPIYVLLIFLP